MSDIQDDTKITKYGVGLVTFYFVNNYGAIITAFSLYDYLEKKGFRPIMISKPSFWWGDFESDKRPLSVSFYENHAKFTEIYDRDSIECLDEMCSSFVVGSDQLWNQKLYADAGYYTMLGFAKTARKISYSTSFGKDYFTNNNDYIKEAKELLKRFEGISVRENSGLEICRNIFGLEAVWNLDAVFLTSKERYMELASEVEIQKPKRYIFAYILDPNPYKDKLIERIAAEHKMDYVMVVDGGAIVSKKELNTKLQVTEANSVQSWISYIADSDFIITDSFHGTCFSIIFQKQFISIKNRGITRMESLLNMFKLENYLIPAKFKITDELIKTYTKPIDWEIINKRKSQLIKQSSEWLDSTILNNQTTQRLPIEKNKQIITDISKIGLNYPITIQTIITKMPRNSILLLSIDQKENTVIDVPKSYGILTIRKTTDHYVFVEFTKTTNQKNPVEIYIGRWLDGVVGKWERLLTTEDLKAIENRLSALEKKNP